MVGGASKKSGKLQAWILQPSGPLCTENSPKTHCKRKQRIQHNLQQAQWF